MRERQRRLGATGDVVIEGRDIGSVVAPEAEVKVFLVADESERARRRATERPGRSGDYTDLRLRDERDASNTQPAADAVILDTTALTVDEVVERIAELVGRGDESHGRDLGRRARDDRHGRQARRTACVYGAERVPQTGGLVVASNHFSWIDPLALGAACPRTLYYMAKVEAHRVPGLGEPACGAAFSVRRGESDRDAVRTMR